MNRMGRRRDASHGRNSHAPRESTFTLTASPAPAPCAVTPSKLNLAFPPLPLPLAPGPIPALPCNAAAYAAANCAFASAFLLSSA